LTWSYLLELTVRLSFACLIDQDGIYSGAWCALRGARMPQKRSRDFGQHDLKLATVHALPSPIAINALSARGRGQGSLETDFTGRLQE
jgi:hypothetical protein